jgi:cytochrome P450
MEGKKMPGPKGNGIFGGAGKMATNPLAFLMDLDKTYPGGIVNWRLLHLNIVLISDPKLVRVVLQTNQKLYIKNSAYKQLKLILGDGLVTSEGELWKRQRKLIQPSFHKQYIYGMFESMLGCANEMTEEWKVKSKAGETIDFADEMMKITLQIIGKTMLSANVKAEAKTVSDALGYLLKAVDIKATRALNIPLWVPTPGNFRFKKERNILDEIIYKIINERRKTGHQKGDLLDMLMESKYEDTGEHMPNHLLKDEVMTIFLAGHETTASALAWTFYLISQHPEVYKKLKAEVKEIVGDGEITFQHLQQLKYTKACLNEGMRLYPPVWAIGRRALEDTMVGDYLIKKDTDILMSPYIIHRHPEYWSNVEAFDPDRWETEEVKEMDKFAYFPFAAGPRMCIGNNFALFEADIIITKIIQNFDFEYVGEAAPKMDPSITLRVKSGMKMKIKEVK